MAGTGERNDGLKFILVDKILDLVPGKSIRAIKTLSLGEEYLADHFPGNPIMPGVMMMEAMVEAASWLLRVTENFRHSLVTLKEARNVKFVRFISPGDRLVIDAEMLRSTGPVAFFKASGSVDSSTVVSGRFELQVGNLADRNPALAATDPAILDALKKRYLMLAAQDLQPLVNGSA